MSEENLNTKSAYSIPKITLAVAMVLGGIFLTVLHQKHKAEAISKVDEVYKTVKPIRDEMVQLYQDRYELAVNWSKEAKLELPDQIKAPFTRELKTEQDLRDFDLYQVHVTDLLSILLSNELAMKHKPKELEKLEESINRKRAAYHVVSLEADDLIKKYGTGQTAIPVFQPEQMLHDQQKK